MSCNQCEATNIPTFIHYRQPANCNDRFCNDTRTEIGYMARFRNIILDGGWRDDSFRRTARIKEFPSNAVIERNMLSAARSISWFLIPPQLILASKTSLRKAFLCFHRGLSCFSPSVAAACQACENVHEIRLNVPRQLMACALWTFFYQQL